MIKYNINIYNDDCFVPSYELNTFQINIYYYQLRKSLLVYWYKRKKFSILRVAEK